MVRVLAKAAFGFNEESLGVVDAGMVAGFIAEPAVPESRPGDADKSAEQEYTAPGKEGEQPGHQEGRDAAGDVRGGEEEAVHAAPFAQWNPVRERQRGVGPRAGFSGAEQETDHQQAGVTPRRSGGHSEGRPPDDDAGQHAARADLFTPPRADDFKGGIG